MVLTNLENKINCIHCGKDNLVSSGGFIVCIACGVTQDRTYSEYRASMSSDKINKTYQNSIGKTIDFVGSLGSQIGHTTGFMKDSKGKNLNSNMVYKFKRLKRNYHDPARIDGNATHLRTVLAFNRVFNSLNLSKDLKYRSLHIYWKHVNSGVRITNHILLIALCLLQAIREAKDRAPVRFSEVIKSFSKNGHRVTNKNILHLARELNIPLSMHKRRAEDYIQRIAGEIKNNLKINEKIDESAFSIDQYELLIIMTAREFLSKISRKERGGVQPFPFAVSIVYLSDRAIARAVKKKPLLTQEKLAKCVNSAEFTIRDHVYRFLGDIYKTHESYLINACNTHLSKRN